jgi:hypothetical protein
MQDRGLGRVESDALALAAGVRDPREQLAGHARNPVITSSESVQPGTAV